MLSEQRYKEILNLLDREGSVKTSTLCSLLGASRETIRRDLENMEARNLLKRIHGGAMGLDFTQENGASYISFDKRQKENQDSKEAVARAAADYIREGQAIALDSGTTALALAKVIKEKFRSLTVVTNSLAVANELADAEGITLVMTGGIYRPDEEAFVSEIDIIDIKELKKTTTFLIFKNTGKGVELVSEDNDNISLDRDKVEDIRKASNRADKKRIAFDDLINHTDDILVARDIVNIAEKGRNPYTFFRVIDREEDSYNIEIYDSLSKQLTNSWLEDSYVAYPGDRVKTKSKLSINENNTMYTSVKEVYKIEGISSYFESLSLWDDIPRYYTISKYTYD